MMSPWKTEKGREGKKQEREREETEFEKEKTLKRRGERKVWVHRSGARTKALLILVALSDTTSLLAYDVWLLHRLPLWQGTRVRESGTTGTLSNTTATVEAGHGSSEESRCERGRARKMCTCLLTCEEHELDKSPALVDRRNTTPACHQ